MAEEFSAQKSEAPFNMAIATLEAIRRILSHIEEIYMNPIISDDLKQKIKINLVKRFYVDASPLLGKEITEKYKEILNLKPIEVDVIDRSSGNPIATHKKRIMFDYDMELKLDKYLIDLQLALQEQNYYMPPRRDLGRAVANFG